MDLGGASWPTTTITTDDKHDHLRSSLVSSVATTIGPRAPYKNGNFAPSSRSFSKPNVVFVLGPPGSGKGTQCNWIERELGFVHLSAGDLLRAERKRQGSEYGELIDRHIKNAEIVPVKITLKLLQNAIAAEKRAIGFLIDGFPRNKDNLDGWRDAMTDVVNVNFVLYMKAPLEVCVQRCLNRGQGRTDDNEDTMQKRIVIYNNETVPIIEHFRKQKLVYELDGTKKPDVIFNEAEKVFEQANFKPLLSKEIH